MTQKNLGNMLTNNGVLLDKNGIIREVGWANSLVLDYSREMVKANKLRLKERDYYLIINSDGKFAVSFTFADNASTGFLDCSVFDFETKEKFSATESAFMPMGKMNLPASSEKGNIAFKNKNAELHIDTAFPKRHIYCDFKRTFWHPEITADIYLEQSSFDSIVVALPSGENKKDFLYNQKITCLSAKGSVTVKGRVYTFDDRKDYGILDWSRGMWSYSHAHFTGVGSGIVNGKTFGYSIDSAFADGVNNGNAFFYDGKCYKLNTVTFEASESNVINTWNISSDDGRFIMHFTPFFNDRTDISFGVMAQHTDRLFGMLNGAVLLEDDTELKIENMPVFHEKVNNK